MNCGLIYGGGFAGAPVVDRERGRGAEGIRREASIADALGGVGNRPGG